MIYYYQYSTEHSNLHIIRKILILIDAVLYIIIVYTIVQTGFFMGMFVHTESSYQTEVFKQMTVKIQKIYAWLKLGGYINRNYLPYHINRLLNRTYVDYCQLTNYVLLTYDKVWSNSLILFIILSVPLNVMANLALILKHLKWVDWVILNHIVIIHSALFIMTMSIMADETAQAHAPTKYLSTIIYSLKNKNQLRLKLQYEEWYHRLTFGKPYGPYISMIGAITHGVVFRVISKI